MLPRITPIAPTRIRTPFDDPDFVWELKHDGFRALAYIEAGSCRLISRKNIVYKSFTRLAEDLSKLSVRDAILDGELVCLDPDGRSLFMDLMRRRRQDVWFYGFDLIWINGEDLRGLPLLARKERLQRLLKSQAGALFAEHVEAKGKALFEAICAKDLEGVVAKHRAGPYTAAPLSWFKVINPNYSQHRGRREMFEKFRSRQVVSPGGI